MSVYSTTLDVDLDSNEIVGSCCPVAEYLKAGMAYGSQGLFSTRIIIWLTAETQELRTR